MSQQYILRDIRTGERYPVSPQGMRIGRESPSDIILPDASVSRIHATVWLWEDKLYIRDEGSTNGTWVNEQLITGPTTLKPSDRVRLGHTVLEVVATGPGKTVVIPFQGVLPSAPARETPAPAIPARHQPAKFRPLLIVGLVALILCGVLALAGGFLVLGGQKGASGILPFLKPTPIPGIERPVLIDGTEVTFVRAEKRDWFHSFTGRVEPSSPHDTFLIVDAEIPPAQYDWDKVSEWDILLNDEIEPAITQGTSTGEVTWVFVVRKTETSFILTLPGGKKVNLAPILR